MGYAGGSTPDPTYLGIDDHSEAIQVDYDPTRITYQELVEVFLGSHDPHEPPSSRQYASILFYHNDDQKQIAERAIAERSAAEGKLWTKLMPAGVFHRAEYEHQKYQLRAQPDLAAEYSRIYPDHRELTNSTAAARVNGYLGGDGTLEQLAAEIDSLGLSEAARQRLLEVVSERSGRSNP